MQLSSITNGIYSGASYAASLVSAAGSYALGTTKKVATVALNALYSLAQYAYRGASVALQHPKAWIVAVAAGAAATVTYVVRRYFRGPSSSNSSTPAPTPAPTPATRAARSKKAHVS
ncbi:MAG: hypothetical protein FJZ63_05550 [Chlamydiae bacterium]|nr:hypothetical protein [Chlamydiota bacterium]